MRKTKKRIKQKSKKSYEKERFSGLFVLVLLLLFCFLFLLSYNKYNKAKKTVVNDSKQMEGLKKTEPVSASPLTIEERNIILGQNNNIPEKQIEASPLSSVDRANIFKIDDSQQDAPNNEPFKKNYQARSLSSEEVSRILN